MRKPKMLQMGEVIKLLNHGNKRALARRIRESRRSESSPLLRQEDVESHIRKLEASLLLHNKLMPLAKS